MGQTPLDLLQLPPRAAQHRDLAERARLRRLAPGLQHAHAAHHLPDALGDPHALGERVGRRHHAHGRALAPVGVQHALLPRVVRDHGQRAAQDRRCRAIVFLQTDAPQVGPRRPQLVKAVRIRPAKPVNRLIRVADDEQLAPFAPMPHQLVLHRIDVLKLVHQQMPEPPQPRVRLQRLQQHVVQIARARLLQRLPIGVHQPVGQLRAAAVLAQRDAPLGLRRAHGLAPLLQQPAQQPYRLALPHQRLFADQFQAQRVERAHVQRPGRALAQPLLQPLPHLLRRLVGKRHRRDVLRRLAPRLHQVRDARHQRARLARSRPRDDRHRPLPRLHGLSLPLVERALLLPRSLLLLFLPAQALLVLPGLAGRVQLHQRRLPGQQLQLVRRKQRDHAVFPVVARLSVHLIRAQTPQRLAHRAPRDALHRLHGQLPQDAELRPQRAQQPQVLRLHALARGGRAHAVGQQLGQRHQALEGPRQHRLLLAAVGQLLHAVRHADGQLAPAHGAAPAQLLRARRLQTHPAGPVPVQMVLPLLREELDGAVKALARLDGALERAIAPPARQQIGLTPQLCRRVRVGIGHQRQPVEQGAAPVHHRVGGQPRLRRAHLPRQVVIALLQRLKPRKRPEQRKMRRPHVRRDVHRLRAALQHDLQQIMAVQPQYGPAVAVQVADGLQPVRQRLRLLQPRQQDHVMHLARAAVLFVDGADLARHRKSRRGALLRHARRKPQLLFERVQPRAVGHQRLAQLLTPRRMGEIPRPHHVNALAPCPEIQVLRVAVPRRRARIFGMDVQIRDHFSPAPAVFLHIISVFAVLRNHW